MALSRGQKLQFPNVVSGLTGLGATIRLEDEDGNRYIDIQSPAALSNSYQLILPLTDGNNGDVLSTDGTGTLSFTAVPAAGSDTQITYNNAGTSAGAAVTTDSNNLYFSDGNGAIFESGTSTRYSKIQHKSGANILPVTNNLVYNLPQYVGSAGSCLKCNTVVNGVHELIWAPDNIGDTVGPTGGTGAVQFLGESGGDDVFQGTSNFTYDVGQDFLEIIGNLLVGDYVNPNTSTSIGVGTFTTRICIGESDLTSEVAPLEISSSTNNTAIISLSNETDANTASIRFAAGDLRFDSSLDTVFNPTGDVKVLANKNIIFANGGNEVTFGVNSPTGTWSYLIPGTQGTAGQVLQYGGASNSFVDNDRVINATFYGGSDPVGTGFTIFATVAHDCDIVEARIVMNTTDTAAITITSDAQARGTTGNYTPAYTTNITPSPGGFTITSGEATADSTLTSWTTALTAGDVLKFEVLTAPSSANSVTVSLIVRATSR